MSSMVISLVGVSPAQTAAALAPASAPAIVAQPARLRPQQQRDYLKQLPLRTLREQQPTTELEHALMAAFDECVDLEEEVEELRGAAAERDSLKEELGEQDDKIAKLEADLDAAHTQISDLDTQVEDLRHQLSQQENSK